MLERIPELLARGEVDKARVESGALFMGDQILTALHPPPTPLEEPDEDPFIDPADISRPRSHDK